MEEDETKNQPGQAGRGTTEQGQQQSTTPITEGQLTPEERQRIIALDADLAGKMVQALLLAAAVYPPLAERRLSVVAEILRLRDAA